MINNELLKKKILDEAIHGRLIENDPSLPPVDLEEIKEDIPFDVPNNWKWVKLSDVSEFNVGKTPPTKDLTYWGDEIDWVSISDMNHRKTIKSTNRKLSNKSLKNIFNNKLVPPGTLLMSFKLTIGRLSITNKPCVHNEAIISIYPKQYLSRNYLMNALDSLDLEENVKSAIKGKTLNSKSLANILIPISPLEEQEKIVKKIDELFELIDKKEKNDKEKEKLRTLLKEKILDTAIRGELVENDLSLPPVDVEEIKEDVPFDIPNNWKWSMFKYVFNIVNGFTPLRTNDDFWNSNDIPWFTVDDIKSQGHIINKTNQFITKKALGKNVNRLIPKDTVLLCCTSATIGNYALTNIELTTNQQWNGLILNDRMNKKIVAKYIYYYVQTLRKKMLIDGNSTTFPFISLKKLGDYLIPIPPLEQQKKIVEKIEKCFELIEQL